MTVDKDILEKLDRAHRMGVSDPSRSTLYSEAAEEIRRLRSLRLLRRREAIESSMDLTRNRILNILLEAGEDPEELNDLETWELIIKYRTDPTLFPSEGADR